MGDRLRRHRARSTVVAALVLLAALGSVAPAGAGGAATGWQPFGGTRSVVEYSFADGGEGPNDVIVGPDGRLWAAFGISGTVGALGADGSRTTYPTSSTTSSPSSLAVGADGRLWVTEATGNAITALTADGARQTFALPWPGSGPQDIVAGPDGALWFTMLGGDAIGRITVEGDVSRTVLPAGATSPFGIAAGADGALWFTLEGNVGRLTTSGDIELFPVPGRPTARLGAIAPTAAGPLVFVDFAADRLGQVTLDGTVTEAEIAGGGGPAGVVEAADGLWVSLQDDGSLVRVTSDGQVLETVRLSVDAGPSALHVASDGTIWAAEPVGWRIAAARAGSSPLEVLRLPEGTSAGHVTVADDGTTWFVVRDGVGRATPDGEVEVFDVFDEADGPLGITLGPDGNVWVTLADGEAIARVTPDGDATEFPVPDGTGPQHITTGPDGALWFTANRSGGVGRMPVTGSPVEVYPLGGTDPEPDGITAGPDGRLWAALGGADALAAVSTAGEVQTFPLAGSNIQPSLVTSSGGAVWYSGFNFGSVGRMATNGSVRGWDLRTAVLGVAPDDQGVWFAYYLNASLGRFDPARGATTVPSLDGEVANVAVGDTYVVAPATLEGQGSLQRLVEATPLEPPLTPLTPVTPTTPVSPPGPAAPIRVTPAFTG